MVDPNLSERSKTVSGQYTQENFAQSGHYAQYCIIKLSSTYQGLQYLFIWDR